MYKKPKYSFEQWCLDNNRNDLLNRWDYNLNNFLPSDVAAKTEKEIWIKCPNGVHESELKRVDALAYGKAKNLHCVKCESFAQNIIDVYVEEYLGLIWSSKNEISPWEISSKNCSRNVIFKCVDNPEHEFKRTPQVYWRTSLCPMCKTNSTRYGIIYPESLDIWSELNDMTPYDYSSAQHDVVFWKCNNGVHDDFKLGLESMVNNNFQCPKCMPKIWRPKYSNRINLLGKRFGKLLVTSIYGSVNNQIYWNCKCDCGNECIKLGSLLSQGKTKTCGNRMIHFKGEDNPNWKGGITPENTMIRTSDEYSRWRLDVYKNDYYSCVICGSREKLEAHHIYPFSKYKDKRLSLENGITLCINHHNQKINGSFHNTYGAITSPQQLEEYINNKRKELGIDIPFNIDDYMRNKMILDDRFIKCNYNTGLRSISIPIIDVKLILNDIKEE